MQLEAKTKVLFLITKSNWGGAQRYVYDLATNLDKELFEPVVALGGKGTLKDLLVHAGVRVISIDSLERDISVRKEWAFIKELRRILKTERPKVLHVNSSKAGAIGTLLGRLTFVPRVIFTAHGWAFNEDRPLWQRLTIKTIHWLTVLMTHKTIAVSTAIVTQMNWIGAYSKMKIIHPGRSIGVMYQKDAAREELASGQPQLQAHQSDLWILTIAELHPIKRLDVLISAISLINSQYPTVRCVIVGEGAMHSALEAQIKSAGLTEQVFLLGNIPEAARFLPAADLFVLPSKSESYGYVLHEAGLAGLPVLATDVGGIPDIITHNQTGRLIQPDDAPALATEIADFVQHTKQWQTYAQQLQEAMQERTTQKMVDATSALYTLAI